MKSFFSGSAVIAATILVSSLLLSAKPSTAETLFSRFQNPTQELAKGPQQDAKRDPVAGTVSASDATATTDNALSPPTETVAKPTAANEAATGKSLTSKPVLAGVVSSAGAPTTGAGSQAAPVTVGSTYTATAYSLSGRTATGQRVTKGLIAADPRVLPLGTRVRIEAGSYTGEYLVADTGGSVRGKKIDIWTPNTRDAFRFGRRLVKLTVLSYPAKRTVTARHRKR